MLREKTPHAVSTDLQGSQDADTMSLQTLQEKVNNLSFLHVNIITSVFILIP